MQSWITKYCPKKPDEIFGQDEGIKVLTSFVTNYKSQKKKAALIHGPPGCGKTAAALAVANSMGLEVIEINASDFRNKNGVESILGPAMKQQSLFFKGKIILCDEIDGLSGTKDRGGIQAITTLMEKSAFPVIFTANNPWGSKFSTLRRKVLMIPFEELDASSSMNVLKKICEKEGIQAEDIALKSLARRNGGDLRAAINDLQTLTLGRREFTKELLTELHERNKTESMKTALVKVLKNKDASIALHAFDSVEEDLDQCALWIDENLPQEYKGKDLADAYNCVSKAMVFKGRIMRWQYWRFLVYVNALLTAGVASSRTEKPGHGMEFKQPSRILSLWKIKMKYQKRKAIAEKMALKTHASLKRTLRSTLPYFPKFFAKNKDAFSDYFEFSEEEADWLSR